MGRARGRQAATAVGSRHDAFTDVVGDDRGIGRPDGPRSELTVAAVEPALTDTERDALAVAAQTDDQAAVRRLSEKIVAHDHLGYMNAYASFVNSYADLLGITDPAAMNAHDRAVEFLTALFMRHARRQKPFHSDVPQEHGAEATMRAIKEKMEELTGENDPAQQERFGKQLLGPKEYSQRRIESLLNSSSSNAQTASNAAFSDAEFLFDLIRKDRYNFFREAARLAQEAELPNASAPEQLLAAWRKRIDATLPLPTSSAVQASGDTAVT